AGGIAARARMGARGGGGPSGRAPARAHPGSRGPAGGGPAEEAGSEEKEARRGHGRRCCRAGTLTPSGDGTIRDQLSLAGTIISVAAEVEEPAIEKRLWRTASERNTKMLAVWQVGSTLTPGASPVLVSLSCPLSSRTSRHTGSTRGVECQRENFERTVMNRRRFLAAT